ncbi:MAG: amino acid adenylation domain-containing protein [Vicinamibacterales bacterium]
MPTLLHEFFARTVARSPERAALDIPPGPGRASRTTVTYAALDAMADDVAARLPDAVGPDTLIALLVARDSPWLVAAQLGVLRTGAAFTCLEPAFPDAHLGALLADAAPAAVVADVAGASRLAALGQHVDVTVGGEAASCAGMPARRPHAESATPSSLAYAIYTSGTSGRPKGVLVEHGSVVNLVQADLDMFGLGPGDRVVQGSSAAYDSSIEETWLALAAGATLVVADDATVRLGPDLVAWLAREHVTVFCPPPTLLRATGCADPATALPELRLLYVGGEALPADVAERWGRGRTLVNGYGPTEATVTVVRDVVRPGAAIAIGRPIANVSAWVLDAEGRVVADGEPGELCLGGAALARGYRNDPALTAARFPDHPVLGRIYRTGDRAVRGDDGRLFYLGRLDAQVKLRGYRIELEAIEASLAAQPGVAQAAAAIQGDGAGQRLVAFVVPEADSAPVPADLRDALRAQLPPHMVPVRLGLLERLPTTVGGKLDRASLPALEDGGGGPATPRRIVAPATTRERIIAAAVSAVLRPAAPVSVHDDFFGDLGGDSLAAGLLVSRLRADGETAHLTTRDVYDARTVAALARRPVPSGTGAGPTRGVAPSPAPLAPLRRVLTATAIQGAWIALEVLAAAVIGYALIGVAVSWLLPRFGLVGTVAIAPAMLGLLGLVSTPLAIAATAAATRLLLPDPPVGRHPAWGRVHVRLWILQRLAGYVPWSTLAGTHALTAALRALGADIGHHVHIAPGVQLPHGAWRRLHLGDRVSVGRDASLRAVDLDGGAVVVGEVRLDDEATLDVHAGMGPGSSAGRGATLGPWASLDADGVIPDGERWDGVPAQRSGTTPAAAAVHDGLGAWTHAVAVAVARSVAAAVFWVPAWLVALALLAASGLTTLPALRTALWTPRFWAAGAIGCVVALLVALGLAAWVTRRLPRERAGTVAARSRTAIRLDLKARLVDGASLWLSGSLFWPQWLRAAGMTIGDDAEVSAIVDTAPDLVTIGDGAFLADGIYLAGPRVDRGTLTVAPVTIGARAFIGNHAVLGPGAVLPDDVLLGVCTVATPAMADAPGAAWFGHPPLPLARPSAVGGRRPAPPTWLRRVNRWLWEAGRTLLPLPLVAAGAWWALTLADLPFDTWRWMVGSVAATVAFGAALALVCLALKWLLLGKVRPGEHALWSCWCSRWDFMYVAWSLYVPWFAGPFEGTLLLPWYLRAMGMRVGRRVLLGPGFAEVVDPDMIAIGDGATVQAQFQAHTFEERRLKMGPVVIGAGATVGAGVVPLYATTVGEGAVVAPHSVILKGESLQPHTAYAGSPIAEI